MALFWKQKKDKQEDCDCSSGCCNMQIIEEDDEEEQEGAQVDAEDAKNT